MSIARCRTVVGSLYALLRNRLGINVATSLESQELSCTVAPDRRLVVLGHEPIAGFARDHGTVANEAAMLALHTLDSTTLLAEPRFVAPGDSCLRADDPGWRWHCISGHGQSLADWERRPLGGALAVLSARADAADARMDDMELDLDSKIGSSALDGYVSTASLTDVLEDYEPDLGHPSSDGMALVSTAAGVRSWADISGSGGGGGYIGAFADEAALLGSGASVGESARITGKARVYLCIAEPSDVDTAWIWWSAETMAVRRFIRLRIDVCPANYCEIFTLRYRMAGTWYPTESMTSNSAPSPLVVSASDQYTTYSPYRAFDGNAGTQWHGDDYTSHWLKLDLGDGNGIRPDAVGITCNLENGSRYPRDFGVELSNTGKFSGEQESIYKTTGQTAWTTGVERVFEW